MGCENKNSEELMTKAILLQTTLPLSVKLVKKRDSLIMKIGGCISNNVKNSTIEQFSTLQFQLTIERNPGLYWFASLHSGSGQEILHHLLLR